MTEKKCGNCKFWNPTELSDSEKYYEWDSNGELIPSFYGICNKIKHNNHKESDPDTFVLELARVANDSNNFAELRTLSNFYCCLYEEKQ